MPGEDLGQDPPQRKDVGRLIHLCDVPVGLLGRHVGRCSHDRAGFDFVPCSDERIVSIRLVLGSCRG